MSDALRPNGVQIDITDSQQIVLKFDHGEIPPIQLSMAGAEQVGSNLTSAAHKAQQGVRL